MFLSRKKKSNVYLCKSQFYYIKVGFKGVKIIRYVFVMSTLLKQDMVPAVGKSTCICTNSEATVSDSAFIESPLFFNRLYMGSDHSQCLCTCTWFNLYHTLG